MRKKLYFDTEFTGLHQKTTLISIGIISECGKKFYAEFTDYDPLKIDQWIDENVIKQTWVDKNKPITSMGIISGTDEYKLFGPKDYVRGHLVQWLEQFGQIEMWSDCLSYDWVLFCDIFGHAFSIPEFIYYIPFDICTLFREKQIDPDINREAYAYGENKTTHEKHNAMWDAIVIKDCHEKLVSISNKHPYVSGTKVIVQSGDEIFEGIIEKVDHDFDHHAYSIGGKWYAQSEVTKDNRLKS